MGDSLGRALPKRQRTTSRELDVAIKCALESIDCAISQIRGLSISNVRVNFMVTVRD